MTRALWAPFEVADLAASKAFYSSLGLPVIDSFPGGLVFGVGPSGRIEVVATPPTGHPVHAIEFPTWGEVDRLAAVRSGLPPRGEVGRIGGGSVFPRGHYGFVTADPDGNELLIWSEARA
jgi:catechol 2,3-dioxygenase-like lactoylglutathione lyase family enzyme